MTPDRAAGLLESRRALAAGEVTSRALVEQTLARIEATQSAVNAFRIVRAEAALAEADAADRELAAGARRPLLGVPVAVKDDMDVAGEPTAFGCRGEFPPAIEDGEAVRRLRAAGAVIVGKTNTCELGQWPFTEGPAFGQTRNPWHTGHTPGGSSGGSAAAVAAGLVPASLGSDGAGSVRIPAAWTHLIGIKPQRGRISTWPRGESFHGITVNGTLARSVADAALLLDAASGNHDRDPHRPPTLTVSDAVGRDPGRLRIALSLKPPFTAVPARLHREVRARVVEVAEELASLGHMVEEADPPYGQIGLAFVPRATAGIAERVREAPDPALLDPRTRSAARLGRLLGGVPLRAARRAEAVLHRRIGAFFESYDVVLAPTTAAPPPRIGALYQLGGVATDRAMIAACPYAWPWNVLGWPGVNVPAGFVAGNSLPSGGLPSSGLPVGAQLLGPAGSEPMLVSLAAQLEAELRWHELWPPTPTADSRAA
ncbi:amidase [Streptomyces pluripotens]|uniref:Amidase n=1 Tax=Streptomyces pluripotens TaxID=1355015 RepID=A0A221NSW9_9ACTN|nr:MULTISPECIES: amidase [Streptomyces]ARP68839.1 amidase [Streptomyces pluripotens]ASN23093.1 amidase [Streptomyces pluripotens]KIE25243.1 amidase [Streptomyces sp. MUSC 125]MCH0556818.1 amidase [Streptomyces sp. MUM 16J]